MPVYSPGAKYDILAIAGKGVGGKTDWPGPAFQLGLGRFLRRLLPRLSSAVSSAAIETGLMFRLRAALVVLCLLPSDGKAQDRTSGNFMLPHCKDFLDDKAAANIHQGVCIGVIGALVYYGKFLADTPFCAPQGSTHGQALRVVIADLERGPADLHVQFAFLAARALHRAWPCP